VNVKLRRHVGGILNMSNERIKMRKSGSSYVQTAYSD